MSNILLGKNVYGTFVLAKIDDKRVIQGFEGYDLIHNSMTYDGNDYLHCCFWDHDVQLGDLVYKSGDVLPENVGHNLTEAELEQYESAYNADLTFCEECGMAHDTDDYGHRGYVITNEGDFYCTGCVTAEELLVKLESPKDLFKAESVEGATLDNFKEVDCLFCDSSGFGQDYERALTKKQAEARAAELIKANPKDELFVGITGMGQFQVYVTIYKRAA